MKPSRYALLIAGIALAGCAGPSTTLMGAGLMSAASPVASDLAGTWRGSFGWPGGSYWPDDGICTLQINGDGTFSGTIKPAPGANNLAKASTWSGIAVGTGHRVTLKSAQGPSVTLTRSGDTLYGVARDPFVEVPISISLEKDRTAA